MNEFICFVNVNQKPKNYERVSNYLEIFIINYLFKNYLKLSDNVLIQIRQNNKDKDKDIDFVWFYLFLQLILQTEFPRNSQNEMFCNQLERFSSK